LISVCYREADDGQFDNFVEEVEKDGRLTDNTKLFLDKLDEKQTTNPNETETNRTSMDVSITRNCNKSFTILIVLMFKFEFGAITVLCQSPNCNDIDLSIMYTKLCFILWHTFFI